MQYTCLLITLALGWITMANLTPRTGQALPESTPASLAELGALKAEVEHINMDLAAVKKQLADMRRPLSQPLTQAQQPGNVVATLSTADNPSLGQPGAPITIIEFSDYQCLYCRRFSQQTLPALKADYIDTGKVHYVFRDFPLDRVHPQARKAAEAAHCARDQGKYWEMHNRLFQNHTLDLVNLKGYARDLGLDLSTFETCLEQDKYAAEVDKDATAGATAGVTGTPSFFIGKTSENGTIEGTLMRGAQSIAVFRQVIEPLLHEQK
jgi:protein-disulfide isomerase